MTKLRRVLVVLFVGVLSFSALAQSADQEVVSVVDSPDPVTPGATLTYTVTVRNNGPDPATNGGVNINLPLAVTHTTDVVPAGWTCFWLGSNGTCNTPSFGAGVTEVITINTTVSPSLAAFPDQSIDANFFPSGTTVDPNNGNNARSASTQVDSPQVDLSVSASDSPDPVFPDGNVTYTVTVTNGGPDTASSVNFNVVPNSSLAFQSATVPAGWTCTLPAVGAINATFTCSRATWSPGTDNFVVVFAANDEQFGINDTSFQTNFNVGAGASNETDNTDNSTTLTTSYTTPDADVSVSVTDSPDPVFPDGNITYTVTVANAGPDPAPNITLSSFGSNNLHFQSATVPAGWNCTLPAAGAQTAGFSCTLPAGLASGGSSVLTFVLQATDEVNGVNDGTIQFGFSANSTVSDPVPGNNSETENTAYVTPDADVSVLVSDSPDPVYPDGNITYTVTVANAGPDTGPNVTLSSFGSNNLRFQSATVPAGWNCTLPAPGTQTTGLTCTLPAGLASGASSVLTFVMQADDALIGVADTTIQFGFSAHSTISDPVPGNNSETESTAYVTPDANLAVTATDAPDPVAAGANLTYTGTIGNSGPDSATDVTFTIALAPQLLFQSLTGPAGFTCTTPAVGANGTITCTAATLESAAVVPYTLVAQVNPSLNNGPDGTIQQQFVIASSTTDPTPSNNSVDVSTAYTTPDADLSVTNADAPDPVAPNATITYTQTIANAGPQPAVNATLTQSTPAGTTFQSLASPAGWTCTTPAVGATGSINCSKATMASGENGGFTLVVNVTAGSGTITSTVTGDSDTYDPDNSDNVASTTTTVIAPASADLSIVKSTATTSAAGNTTFPYTIAITNGGPDAAANVVMTDVLPAGLLFESITTPAGFLCTTPAAGANGTITCGAATLANGAVATFTLTVRVAANATSGSVTNTASVASDTADPDSGDATGSAAPVALAPAGADLSIVKTTAATTATPGNTITYTITVTNAGPSPATNVVVADTLPAGLAFLSATPSQGTCNNASPVTCNLGTLASGANATITLQATVTASSGTISNTASVSATEPDPDGGDNASSAPPIPVVLAPAAAAIPTLSEWMLMILAGLLGLSALVKMRM